MGVDLGDDGKFKAWCETDKRMMKDLKKAVLRDDLASLGEQLQFYRVNHEELSFDCG